MADQYMKHSLRMSIAQICQTIGYNSIQTTPLELLQDCLHKLLHEFCRYLRRHVEHYNRTEANLNDVVLTLGSLSINVNELLEYIFNVQPVSFVIEVPVFPIYKDSNFNFLKPGSKEVLIRPVHIYEHLPPILPLDEYVWDPIPISEINAVPLVETCSTLKVTNEYANVSHIVKVKSGPAFVSRNESKTEYDIKSDANKRKDNFLKAKVSTRFLDDEGRPAREIGSVMMTTGGYISPAIEGKLPDAGIPDIIDILDGLDVPLTPLPISAANGCPATNNTAALSVQALPGSVISKIEIEEKPANTNAYFEKWSPTSDDETVQNEHMSTSGGFSNAGAAVSLAKKLIPLQPSTLPPPLAARILKKGKKKHKFFSLATHGKPIKSIYTGHSSDLGSSETDLNDKAQRKRLKMLQKLVKSVKSTETESSFTDSNGNTKTIPGFYNSGINSAPSPGIQLENIIKKQVKQKKKLLKQQMAFGLNSKCSSISEQTQQDISSTEASNIPTSSTISSADQMPSFAFIATSYLGCKIENQANNTGINLEGNISKLNSTAQSFLNSTTPYKGGRLENTDVSVFDHNLIFGDEEMHKDISNNQLSELKLSTEPDRCKLNIFKKISSKQKHINRSSPITGNAPSQTKIYARNENPMINLPSGTTIYPAPTTSGRRVYAPQEESFLPLIDGIAKNNPVANINQNKGYKILGRTSTIDQQNKTIELANKPKKRGRKPGSKNQPKVHGINLMAVSEKAKKIKMPKHIFGPPLQLPIDQGIEPLNLTHSFSLGCDVKTDNVPLGISSPYFMLDTNSSPKKIKERREKRRAKVSKILPTSGHDIHAYMDTAGRQQQQQKKNQSKNCFGSAFSAPTKEEVDSINRKLLRMDTVLQPAPPIKSSTITHGSGLLASREMYSPTKWNDTDSSVKPLCTQQRNTVSNLSSSSEIPVIPSVQNYSNLHPNLLSMLPMYPFPPRPGLIPTPGLFPSVLGTFPKNASNPVTNMLLQGFSPFSGLNPSASGHLLSPDVKMTDKTDKSTIKEACVAEINYCNVAPLVPDSVQLKLSSPGAVNSTLVSPKHGNIHKRDTPKTPQLIQSPTISEIILESLQRKLSAIGTPESKCSKSIPSTPGGISLSTFDSLLRGGSSISTNSSISNNSVGLTAMFRPISLPPGMDNQKFPSIVTSSLNIDGPIEVSDDSVDEPISMESSNPTEYKTSQRSFVKGPTLPAPLINQIDDLFIPIENKSPIGVRQFTRPYISNKGSKKTKKNKKNNSFEPGVCVPGSEGGVGKLSGGADLIPLSATGLAYSSKSTPPNSLTASATSSSFEISKIDFAAKDLLGNLTVIPSPPVDMHGRRKDHKKPKKYGKMKKKKDKKEKIRSKKKYLDKLEKRVKERDSYKKRYEDVPKKIKKGKKRGKQRAAVDSLSSSTVENFFTQSLVSSALDVSMNLTSVLPFTASTSVGPSASVVPKLTLKLGNCQSPATYDDMKSKLTENTIGSTVSVITRESSPELARISPLVTRPPKQKSSGIDSASHSNAIGGLSSGSNDLGTLNTTELFVDSKKNNIRSNSNISSSSIPPPPSSWSTGDTLTASSTLLPQQLLQSISQHSPDVPSTSASSTDVSSFLNRPTSSVENTASLMHETNRPSSYIDEEGNRVWICPACGKVDDGSAMIGCDSCDAWYHWVCVGIYVAPKDNEDWFCRVCITKKKSIHSIERKRKRNKKNK